MSQPIDIPKSSRNVTFCNQRYQKTCPLSPVYKSPSSISPISPTKFLTLEGPFINKFTVNRVISEEIPILSKREIFELVNNAHIHNFASVEIKDNNANLYCQRLIDNGFISSVQ